MTSVKYISMGWHHQDGEKVDQDLINRIRLDEHVEECEALLEKKQRHPPRGIVRRMRWKAEIESLKEVLDELHNMQKNWYKGR